MQPVKLKTDKGGILGWVSILLVGRVLPGEKTPSRKFLVARQRRRRLFGMGALVVSILWLGLPFWKQSGWQCRGVEEAAKFSRVWLVRRSDRWKNSIVLYSGIQNLLPKYAFQGSRDATSSLAVMVGFSSGLGIVLLLVAGLSVILLGVIAKLLQVAIAKLQQIEANNQQLSQELEQRRETEAALQQVNQHLETLLQATNEQLQQTQKLQEELATTENKEQQYLQIQETLLLFDHLVAALVEDVSEQAFIEQALQWVSDRFFPQVRLTYIAQTETGWQVLGCVAPETNRALNWESHDLLTLLNNANCRQKLHPDEPLAIENLRSWLHFGRGNNCVTTTELATAQAVLLVPLTGLVGRDFLCLDDTVPRQWKEGEISLLKQVAPYLRLGRQQAACRQQLTQERIARQENEARFRQMAENVREVFWVATPDRKQVLYASRAYETIWGRQRQSLYETPYAWLETIHSSDRQRVLSQIAQPLSKELTQEYRIVRPDGKVVWIRDRAFPIYDEKAEVSRIAGIATDISEHKYAQMEAQLLHTINQSVHSSETFADTLVVVLSKICILTGWDYAEAWIPDGEVLKFACGWYGDRWELEQFYQNNMDLAFALGEGLPGTVWQSPQPKWLYNLPKQSFHGSSHLEAAMAAGLESGLGVPMVSNEQVVAVFLFFSERIHPEDTHLLDLVATLANQLGLILTHKQFETKLQEREEVLRLFVEHNPAAVAMLDRQMRYLVASRRWLQDYDLGDIDIVGRSHYDLFPHLDAHWQDIHQRCLQGEVQSCEEEQFYRADGSLDWLRWEMHPWHDETHIGGIIMFSDIITQRKQAEAELQRTNEQLQASVEKLEQNNREITLLGQLSEILQACLHLEEAYKAIESFLPPLFPYCSGSVYILDRENYLANAIVTWGNFTGSEAVFYPNDCWALRQWHPHFTNRRQDQLLCNHTYSQQVVETLCIPMTAQGKALGLLHLNTYQHGILTEDRQQFAVTVSEHMSLALANLTLRETLQRQSICDSLTGLYNRRYLEEALEGEIHRARRKKQSVALLMVDIDHFKRFNDNFGHEVGDAVLQEVGKLLMQNIRPGDIACRYGGEEMTLILPDTDVTVAKQRAEEIREAIKQLRLEYHPPQLGLITASLGVAFFPTHGNSGSAILQVADAALYTAKAQGRDRVVVARTRGSA